MNFDHIKTMGQLRGALADALDAVLSGEMPKAEIDALLAFSRETNRRVRASTRAQMLAIKVGKAPAHGRPRKVPEAAPA